MHFLVNNAFLFWRVFYYDLRVRKEAFDLQLMMNPGGPVQAPAPGAPPSLA